MLVVNLTVFTIKNEAVKLSVAKLHFYHVPYFAWNEGCMYKAWWGGGAFSLFFFLELYALLRKGRTIPKSKTILCLSDVVTYFVLVSRVNTRTVNTWRCIASPASWFLTRPWRWISCFILGRPGDITRQYRLRSTVCRPWMWRYLAKELTWRYSYAREFLKRFPFSHKLKNNKRDLTVLFIPSSADATSSSAFCDLEVRHFYYKKPWVIRKEIGVTMNDFQAGLVNQFVTELGYM